MLNTHTKNQPIFSQQWLVDHVFAIREAATINLKKLVEAFGVEWAQEKVIPKVLQLAEDSSYLRRMTTIFSLNELSSVLPTDVIIKLVLPTLTKLSKDKVCVFIVEFPHLSITAFVDLSLLQF